MSSRGMHRCCSISRTAALALVTLVTLASVAGCRMGTRHTAPVVIGPVVGSPSAEAFERLLQTARSNEYEPIDDDLSIGVFRVDAHWGSPRGAHRFVVQCFHSGHVQIVAAGPRVRRDGADYVLPTPLRDELIAFTRLLAAGAGVSRDRH